MTKHFKRCAAKWGNRPREEQLALRIYNLELNWDKDIMVNRIKWACNHSNSLSLAFDDEFWMADRNDVNDMVYIQVIQIVRCYGKELVLRFLSFNYKDELESVG